MSPYEYQVSEASDHRDPTPRADPPVYNSLSRVLGRSWIHLPVAWWTAFAIAPATPVVATVPSDGSFGTPVKTETQRSPRGYAQPQASLSMS